jgi:DNA-binding CsgD family transcriptional regulator
MSVLAITLLCLCFLMEDQSPVPLDLTLFFLTTGLLFLLGAALNDYLISKAGEKTMVLGSLLFAVLGPLAFLIPGLSVATPVLCAIATSCFVLLWGSYLSTLNHSILIFLLLSTSSITGIFSLFVLRIDTTQAMPLVSLLFVLSWLSLRMVSTESIMRISFASKSLSRERSVPGKGNRYTLVLVGIMLGSSVILMARIDLSAETFSFVLGGCLIATGLFMLLSYRFFQAKMSDFAKRTIALAMAIGLLPFPFVGAYGQIACACFLFFVGAVNLILVVDGVSETARFNLISPFWIVGIEGAVLLGGVFLAIVLFAAAFNSAFIQGPIVVGILASALSSILQISINNQAYPIFGVAKDNAPVTAGQATLTRADDTALARPPGMAIWRAKIDVITEEYHLSLRQKEIMELLIKGRDSRYIMEHFCISRSTAKTHVYNLYKKIEIHSRQELLDLIEQTRISPEMERGMQVWGKQDRR